MSCLRGTQNSLLGLGKGRQGHWVVFCASRPTLQVGSRGPPTAVNTRSRCHRKHKQPAWPRLGGPHGFAPPSPEGGSRCRPPAPTDSPCQGRCQLTRPQSSPVRQVPELRVVPVEGAVPSSGAGWPVECGVLIPQHPSRKRSRSRTGQRAGKSLGHLSEGSQSKCGPTELPHVSRNQPDPGTCLAHWLALLPDAAPGRGMGCPVWEPTVGSCTPTSLGSRSLLGGSSGRCICPQAAGRNHPHPSRGMTENQKG